ncbi:MAG: glycosyltransferase family 2 protein [Clostridiales bacterium]|nr:glycosyltransferase family 2 protein [Clostridiales bacterium]
MEQKQLLSLIIPVYYEEEVLEESYARMDAAMQSTGHPYEIIYVNDGSRDGTMKVLRKLAKEHEEVKVLSFSRNFGHQLAVTCGMDAAKGDALIIIDVDLQDPPEIIPQMVERWKAGAEIVYGKRAKREGETIFKKLTAAVYYRLLRSMSAYPIPLDTGDFRLLDRKVADVFLEMRENARFLRGMSAWMGFEAEPLEYVRQERAAGKTKYTLKKMLKLAMDGITGFSSKPLTLPLGWGVALSVLAVLALIFFAVMWIQLPNDKLIWIYSLGISGFVLLQGITFIFMAIQGMYLGRVYDEVKRRPLYIVAEKLNI